jgi:hypothetical protein
MLIAISLSALVVCASAADSQLIGRGKQEEQRSCIQCHSLRLINTQRLSRAGWEKEINKMIGWGASVSDRQLLLDYLSQEYSATKPIPAAELTGNGTNNQNAHTPEHGR